MKKRELTPAQKLALVVASLRRARNQLERLLRSDNGLDDAARQMLWKEHQQIADHASAIARRRLAAVREAAER